MVYILFFLFKVIFLFFPGVLSKSKYISEFSKLSSPALNELFIVKYHLVATTSESFQAGDWTGRKPAADCKYRKKLDEFGGPCCLLRLTNHDTKLFCFHFSVVAVWLCYTRALFLMVVAWCTKRSCAFVQSKMFKVQTILSWDYHDLSCLIYVWPWIGDIRWYTHLYMYIYLYINYTLYILWDTMSQCLRL